LNATATGLLSLPRPLRRPGSGRWETGHSRILPALWQEGTRPGQAVDACRWPFTRAVVCLILASAVVGTWAAGWSRAFDRGWQRGHAEARLEAARAWAQVLASRARAESLCRSSSAQALRAVAGPIRRVAPSAAPSGHSSNRRRR